MPLHLKRPQKVQHFRLDGNIERGQDLVTDQQVRFSRQRAGDSDALPFTGFSLFALLAVTWYTSAGDVLIGG